MKNLKVATRLLAPFGGRPRATGTKHINWCKTVTRTKIGSILICIESREIFPTLLTSMAMIYNQSAKLTLKKSG